MATKQSFSTYLSQLEEQLDLYLVQKAPELPDNIKNILVIVIPWLVIIGIVVSIPAILAAFGISAVLAPAYVFTQSFGLFAILSTVVSIVGLVFNAMAIPGLLRKDRKGWTYSFYATLIGILSGLIAGSFVSALLGGLIGLYLLFQIKEKYR